MAVWIEAGVVEVCINVIGDTIELAHHSHAGTNDGADSMVPPLRSSLSGLALQPVIVTENSRTALITPTTSWADVIRKCWNVDALLQGYLFPPQAQDEFWRFLVLYSGIQEPERLCWDVRLRCTSPSVFPTGIKQMARGVIFEVHSIEVEAGEAEEQETLVPHSIMFLNDIIASFFRNSRREAGLISPCCLLVLQRRAAGAPYTHESVQNLARMLEPVQSPA